MNIEDIILDAIIGEIHRQASARKAGAPYIDDTDMSDVLIDGHVDMKAVASAIVKAISGRR